MKKLLICAICALFALSLMAPTLAAAEEDTFVYYENDFSSPSALDDFTMYRSVWEVRDGALWLAGEAEGYPDKPPLHGFVLYTAKNDHLENYILEVDVLNVTTQGGPLIRCDLDQASGKNNNSFYGYAVYVSTAGTLGAVGRTNAADGGWAGNLDVGKAAFKRGDDLHIWIKVEGTTEHVIFTDLHTGAEYYNVTLENDEFAQGSFGFRLLFTNAKDGASSVGTTHFDNLKVTLIGEEARAAKAAAAAAAAPVTQAPAAAATTPAPAVSAPKTADSSILTATVAAAAAAAAGVCVLRKKHF